MAALEVQSLKAKVQSQIEPESEPIEPGGMLVRVNLRPFVRAAEVRTQKAEGRRQTCGEEALVRAMLKSARRVKGEPALMRRRLAAAVRWCRKNLPQQAAKLERLATEAGEAGYPALHHSPAYRKAYRPAYRVVFKACLRRPRVSGRTG